MTPTLVTVVLVVAALCSAFSYARATGAGRLPSTQASTQLPAGNHLLTPYVSTDGETLVVHVQPSKGNAQDWILDARTGARWAGAPSEVMSQFRRLGTESPANVQAGSSFDQLMMRQLGCVSPVGFCTSPADASVVLLMRLARGGELSLEVIDLRGLLVGMDQLMAGQRAAKDVANDEKQWQLVQLAARDPERRTRWLDALRSINSVQQWQRVAEAAESGPRLLQWPSMRSEMDGQGAVDLASELELLALKINVDLLARAVMSNPRDEQIRALADGLLLGGQVGFRGDVASHLVDVLLQRNAMERKTLRDLLEAEARRRQSHGLWCYGQWMAALACGGRTPWEGAQALLQGSPAPGGSTVGPDASTSRPSVREQTASTGGQVNKRPIAPKPPPANQAVPQAPAPKTQPAPVQREAGSEMATARAGDPQQEWAMVQGQTNKQVLLSYKETSGHLSPETGAVAGLSFVARAMGPVQEGRFEVQIAPNPGAPLLLQHGVYRVKVRLVLDYAREDRCQAGLLCLFSSAERHARTERRDVVFVLTPENRHTERQRANFGNLVPLNADGGQRYISSLKEARLAIDGVRFDLK